MKYCAKCGTKLEEGKNFCPQCGYKIGSKLDNVVEDNIDNTQILEKSDFVDNTQALEKSNPVKSTEIINVPAPVRTNLAFSKKAKIAIAVVCVFIAALISLYMVGSSITKPSKVVLKFQKAVASDNKAELTNILYSNDNRLEISEKSIAPLLTYFKDNPSYLNTTIQGLNSDALKIEQLNGLAQTNTNNSQGVLSLTYVGKKFLFFSDYKISIKPSFIEVNTKIKDVDISLGSTKIGKSDSDNYKKEFGPYVPGKYKLSADYKGKYVSLSEPQDIDLVANNGKTSINVFTKLNYIRISSEYPDAKIFVNGKDTGIKVADAQNFGPLNAGTKVSATITKAGKTLKSDEYTVREGDTSLSLSFAEAENIVRNIEGDLHDLVRWYTYYFTQAVNYNDFEIVEDYLYPGSKLYNDQKSYIPSTYNQGIREAILSFNILSYNLSDDNKSGSVTTEEVYEIDNKGTSSVKSFKYTYTFKYNEAKGHFQLSTIDTTSK